MSKKRYTRPTAEPDPTEAERAAAVPHSHGGFSSGQEPLPPMHRHASSPQLSSSSAMSNGHQGASITSSVLSGDESSKVKRQKAAHTEGIDEKDDEVDEFEHELTIFYQSLEYPRAQTKNLSSFLNETNSKSSVVHSVSSTPVTSSVSSSTPSTSLFTSSYGSTFTASDEDRNSSEYHNQVKSLLLNIIDTTIKPDIIVLGEYTPLYTPLLNFNYYMISGYRIVDCVKASDGRRGMTVLVKVGVKNVHRITVHDGTDDVKDHWINTEAESSRTEIVNYSNGRKVMKQKWKKAVGVIGECIEIMYKNRYIAMVHVPNGSSNNSPINRAKSILADMLDHAHMGGDLNAKIDTKQKHCYNKPISNSHTVLINTDVTDLLQNTGSSSSQIQFHCNVPGKTTYSTAHDGVYILSQERTNLEVKGSIWPIIQDQSNTSSTQGTYKVIGDHKGFLMKLTTTSRFANGYDTETEIASIPDSDFSYMSAASSMDIDDEEKR